MATMYGEGTSSYSVVAKWAVDFEHRSESLKDGPSSHQADVTDPQTVAQVEA